MESDDSNTDSVQDTVNEIRTDLQCIRAELDKSLTMMLAIRNKMTGMCLTYNGYSQPLDELLDIWSKEYEKGDKPVTWLVFLLDKMALCL
jgi:hypothetical protein